MKKIFTTLMLNISVCLIYAQQSSHIGIEFGVSKDIYQIFENAKEMNVNSSQLRAVRPPSAIVGLNFRQDLNSTFYIEAGLHAKKYSSAIGFKFEQGYGSTTEFQSLMIPVRVGAKINLYKDKIQITPNVGYTFVNNSLSPFGGGSGEGEGTCANPGIRYKYSTSTQHCSKSHALLQTGIGLDFKLTRATTFTLSSNYYQGTKKIITQDIKYCINNQPEQTANSYSTGDMCVYSFGLRYNLSHLLKK